MAKWGEGDPRWIVEERPDATNVNNWHWTEKNASHWSKEKLKSLLENLSIEDSTLGQCVIKEVTSIDGEAVANNRKGKLIFFYEWVIKCSWKGQLNGTPEEYTGKLEIPNLSEENSAEDITIDVSIDQSDSHAELLKEMVRTKGLQKIRDKMKQYIIALRDEFAKDMIKPTKLNDEGNINSFQTEIQLKDKEKSTEKSSTNKALANSLNKNVTIGVKIETTGIRLKENFKCTAEEIYRVFTDVNLLEVFTQNKVKCDPIVGGQFSLLDGNISGKFTYLEPNKCIKQNWRVKNWPVEHYSEVTITIEQQTDTTEVTLVQNGVPSTDLDRTEDGWKKHYFESIKRSFGFGTSFF